MLSQVYPPAVWLVRLHRDLQGLVCLLAANIVWGLNSRRAWGALELPATTASRLGLGVHQSKSTVMFFQTSRQADRPAKPAAQASSCSMLSHEGTNMHVHKMQPG